MYPYQIHVGQSLRQVQQFLAAHADAVPSAVASNAKSRLDAAVAELDGSAIAQGTLARERRGEVKRRAKLERTLVRKYLTPLAQFARASLKGAPDYAALTPSAKALRRERLVKTALSMAAAATRYVADLADAQFPADFLDQLRASAAAVQESFDSATATRVRRTGVTKGIRVTVADGRRAVATLDAIVGHTIVGNESLEREWRAAKRVRRAGAAGAGVAVEAPAAASDTTRAPAVAVAGSMPQGVKAAA